MAKKSDNNIYCDSKINFDEVLEKYAALKEQFPDCFKPKCKKNDNTDKNVIDNLNNQNNQNYFRLEWPGKSLAQANAYTDTNSNLIFQPEGSLDFQSTENLYIEGDNIDALKLLDVTYHQRIKMIYMDPPYNTGQEFIYKDKFYARLTNQLSGKIIKNANVDTNCKDTESFALQQSRFHAQWCSMMYPRLVLARNLLTEDGAVFVSIDDNEVDNLRLIMCEIFGGQNFVACLPTIMNLKGNNDQKAFAGTHEYTVVFAKNKLKASFNNLPCDNLDKWSQDKLGYFKKGANLKATGRNAPLEKRPNLWFPLYISKDDKVHVSKPKGTFTEVWPVTKGQNMSWRWSKDKFLNNSDDVIVKRRNGKITLYKKQRPIKGALPTQKPKSILYKPQYSSGSGTSLLKKIFGKNLFDASPKPLALIEDLIRIGADKDSIILDAFSGSGTTAHAVLKLNSEDLGSRTFIMLQIPENCSQSSEAYKQGYTNICEIGKERIRRVIENIRKSLKKSKIEHNLDLGFKVYKIQIPCK